MLTRRRDWAVLSAMIICILFISACAPATTPAPIVETVVVEKEVEVPVQQTVVVEVTAEPIEAVRPPGVPGPGLSPTLDRIYENGVMRVGYAPGKPGAYVDPDTGRWVGQGPAVAQRIADRLGVPEVQVGAEWDGVVQGLPADKYDVVFQGLAFRPERDELIDYVFVGEAGTCILARADDDRINSFEDLRENSDLVLGLITGISFEDMVRNDYPEINLVSIPSPGAGQLWEEVLTGRIDATMGDALNLPLYARMGEGKLKIVPEDCLMYPLFGYQWGYGVQEGDKVFQEWLDAQVKEMKESGWYEDMYLYWVLQMQIEQ